MLMFLAPFLRPRLEPEIVCNEERERSHGDANQHQAAFALFPSRLLGFFRGVLSKVRGGLW